MNYPDGNPKTVFGVVKPSVSDIPPSAIIALGHVMQFGATKYGHFNWRREKVSSSVYYNAAQRHLMAWLDGEEFDPDTGQSHLAHVMACCGILIDAENCGTLNDDRDLRGVVVRPLLDDEIPF